MKKITGRKFGIMYVFQDRRDRKIKSKYKVKYTNSSGLKMLCFYIGYYIFRFYAYDVRTLKQRRNSIKYRFKNWVRNTKDRLIHWYKCNFHKKVIYYALTSTDCDMFTRTSFGKSKNYREYYNWLNDGDAWDWVEGSVSVDEITESEYLEYSDRPPIGRDRIMEAYENGNGRSIYV